MIKYTEVSIQCLGGCLSATGRQGRKEGEHVADNFEKNMRDTLSVSFLFYAPCSSNRCITSTLGGCKYRALSS